MSPNRLPRVVAIEPSPVHPRQWLLRFTCGHRVSVTSKIKPHPQRYSCGDCWLRFHRMHQRAR